MNSGSERFTSLEQGREDEFVQAVADQILKRHAQDFRKSPVGNPDFAIQRNREHSLIEMVNQGAKTLLRARDNAEERLELRIRQ